METGNKSVTVSTVVTYFIQAAHGGPIKIGKSTEGAIRGRLATLQTSSPHQLVLCRTMHGDHERKLHLQFAADRLQGEWFRATRDLAMLANAKIENNETTSIQGAFIAGYRRGHQDGTEAFAETMGVLMRDVRRSTAEVHECLSAPSTEPDHRHVSRVAFKEYVSELHSNTTRARSAKAVSSSTVEQA